MRRLRFDVLIARAMGSSLGNTEVTVSFGKAGFEIWPGLG
jgi:hypothetical protein